MNAAIIRAGRRIPLIVAMLAFLPLATAAKPVVTARVDSTAATPAATPDIAPPPSFAIYPKETGPRTFFDVKQDAGSKQTYTVVLVNAGDKTQGDFKGRTFVVDGRAKVNGGLDSGGPNEPKTGETAWFDYPNDVLTLQPGKGVERTFTVTVPTGTQPGQYVTALCFETADPLPVPGVPNLKQNLRQTIAFYLTVPGAIRPEFSIENVRIVTDPGFTGVEAEIHNTGNILIRPEGRLTIKKPDGPPLLTTELGFGAFYADRTGTIQTGIGDLLPPGQYVVTIELRDPKTGATAIVDNQPVATTSGDAAAVAAPPVSFSAVSAQIRPSAAKPQFLNLDATLANTGDPVADAELSL